MGKRLPDESIEELRNMSWKEYIASRYWRRFSKKVLDDPDCCCAICGKHRWAGVYSKGKKKGKPKRADGGKWNLHHLSYSNLGEEVVGEDVMILHHSEHDFGHTLEMLARTKGGVYIELYALFKERTGWEYIKFEHLGQNNAVE
jgi:hypothetical protein